MSTTQFLNEGLDPTPLACINKSELLQMIRNASPVEDSGWIVWKSSAPNVVATPEYANFLWGLLDGSGNRTSSISYYNGTSWQLIPLSILDGSIALTKISLVGSTPYFIIQVNAAGTALVWTSIINAIQDNTLPPIKLIAPDNTNNYVLTCLMGVKAFVTIANFFASSVPDNTIPVAKLVFGAAGRFLRTNSGATSAEWLTADITDILAAGFVAGQAARRNSGNTSWEAYTPAVNAAPTFIGPINVYSGPAISWDTYAGSAGMLAGKLAAIVDAQIVWNTAADGNAEVSCRKDGGGSSLIVVRGASIDAFQCGAQAIIPLTTDGKFDYQVIFSSGGGAILSATLRLIGYIG